MSWPENCGGGDTKQQPLPPLTARNAWVDDANEEQQNGMTSLPLVLWLRAERSCLTMSNALSILPHHGVVVHVHVVLQSMVLKTAWTRVPTTSVQTSFCLHSKRNTGHSPHSEWQSPSTLIYPILQERDANRKRADSSLLGFFVSFWTAIIHAVSLVH